MREIFGPVVRHLAAWHRLTLPLLVVLLVLLFRHQWQIGLSVTLVVIGWIATDVSGHAAIHHKTEWTANWQVRWIGQLLAIAGVALIIFA